MTSQLVPPISIEIRLAASPGAAQPFSAPTPAAGPDRTSITGRVATCVDRHRAAVALQQQQRARQAELAQLLRRAR